MRNTIETTVYGCRSCKKRAVSHLVDTDLYFCPNLECEDYFDITDLA